MNVGWRLDFFGRGWRWRGAGARGAGGTTLCTNRSSGVKTGGGGTRMMRDVRSVPDPRAAPRRTPGMPRRAGCKSTVPPIQHSGSRDEPASRDWLRRRDAHLRSEAIDARPNISHIECNWLVERLWSRNLPTFGSDVPNSKGYVGLLIAENSKEYAIDTLNRWHTVVPERKGDEEVSAPDSTQTVAYLLRKQKPCFCDSAKAWNQAEAEDDKTSTCNDDRSHNPLLPPKGAGPTHFPDCLKSYVANG